MIAEDKRVVRYAGDDLVRHPAHPQPVVFVDVLLRVAAELDVDRPFGPHQLPRVAEAQPLVGLFDLPAVDDFLVEDPEFIADPVPHRGNLERGERIDEAGRQAAEPAVAQARLLLLRQQFLEIHAEFRHAFPDRVEDSEVDEVVAEMRTHEEFGGQIGDRA